MPDNLMPENNEESSRGSEQRFRTLFNTMTQGVVYQDASGRIILANPAAESILGRSLDQMIGRTSLDQGWKAIREDRSDFPGDAHPSAIALRIGQEVKGVRMGVFNPQLDEYRWLNINAVPLFRPGEDKPYEVYTTLEDMTDLARIEENLAQVLQETKRERDRLRALEGVAEVGLSSLDRQELLDLIVRRVVEGLDAHSGHIMLLDEKKGDLIAQAVFNVPGQFETRVPIDEGFVGMVHEKRGTVYIADIGQDPRVTDPFLVGVREIKSLLGAPIAKRDRFLGVLYVNTTEVREFDEADHDLLTGMAAAVANAVENARLYEELQHLQDNTSSSLDMEKHLSYLMQQALLPQHPSISEDYEVVLRYQPMFEGRDIGGDFYDIFEVHHETISVMIGDVSGKGLEAASMAAVTRSTVHAFVHEEHSPGEVLTKSNSVLSHGRAPFDQFVTLFLAIIDKRTGDIRYSSAGHPPGIIHRSNGRVELLEPGNLPIATFDDWTYGESQAKLDPGDKLIIYTDGISEAGRGGDLLEIEGISQVIRERGSLSPHDLATEIMATASRWADGKLTDDAAIVILQRRG